MNPINRAEYEESFFDDGKAHAAWEKAWETRTFEIEMYWKRATYFWAFIASAFAGYIAILRSKNYPDNEVSNVEFSILCIGHLPCCIFYLWKKQS